MNAVEIFSDELSKLAKIFGAEPDPFATSTHPAIDPAARRRAIHEYAMAKGHEEPTGLGAALGGGGAIGAIPGGLLGMLAGGPGGALLGAGIGGGLGAGAGALIRHLDIGRIGRAKRMLASPYEQEKYMAEGMDDAERRKTQELSPTKAALLSHLLDSMHRDRDRD